MTIAHSKRTLVCRQTRRVCAIRLMLAKFPVIALAMWMAIAIAAPIVAQSESREGDDREKAWWGIVTAKELAMRSGPHNRYYAVGSLESGDFVRVLKLDVESGWARISAPKELSAFARVSDLVLSGNGKKASAPTRTYGSYNHNDNPAESWRRFVIEPDTDVEVRGTIESGGTQYYKVSIPEDVAVAVRFEHIRRATDDEIKRYLSTPANQDEDSNQPEMREDAPVAPVVNTDTPSPSQETTEPVIDKPQEEELVPNMGAGQAEPDQDREDADTPPTIDEQPAEVEDPASLNVNMPAKVNETKGEEALTPEIDPSEMTGSEGDVQTDSELEMPVAPEADDLETAYQAVRKMPLMEAEIEPLLAAYQMIEADESQSGDIRRLARARVLLLETRLDLQKSQQRILETLERTEADIQQALEINDQLNRTGSDYLTARGRFMPSKVFDGFRLPKRYRLLDRVTGRTIVYIRPPAEGADGKRLFEPAECLRSMVQVSGRVTTEPGMNIRILRVQTLEVLADDEDVPRTAEAVAPGPDS